MRGATRVRIGLGSLLIAGTVLTVAAWVASCGTAPTPFVVRGPGGVGNEPPTLAFLQPDNNITRGQGDPFLIGWTDTDRDDNARISFHLVSTTSNRRVLLTEGIAENDLEGPDTFLVPTTLIPTDSYHLLGTIDDGVNAPVEVYATVSGAAIAQRVIVRVVGPGEGPQTVPPIITVTEPQYNLSMAQDDVIRISVQPTALAPDANNPVPFDPDSTVRLFILLDMDLNPSNDDPANPNPAQIILLQEQTIQRGAFEAITFERRIDIAAIPPRSDGEPYYVRATADDGTNPRVHRYAVGTISIVQLAAGTVDLFDIGRTRSGAKFQGFNPGANVGSSVATVTDFDADGIDDFVIVAQFGNPQNVGPVGEAYLLYGQDEVRFGGTITVNEVGDIISGVVFQAPPIRTSRIPGIGARTDGIVFVGFLDDISGDGRPELAFGLPHVHGAYDSTDYDPADEDLTDRDPFGCYPDNIVNNVTNGGGREIDVGFYAGGMAVVVNSQNRDNAGFVNQNRLESTAVSLELVGQWLEHGLDGGGLSDSGFILPRADNSSATSIGNDPAEGGRLSGARLIDGGFDYVFLDQAPREGWFGQSIASLGDYNSDTISDIIISAPRQERYLHDLESESFRGTHWGSTMVSSSLVILPGLNYNSPDWREIASDTGTSTTPYLDQHRFQPYGRCSGALTVGRHYVIPAEQFGVFAEDIDDMLGNGQSAGDFNQDGLDDILCGAPLNNRSSTVADSGSAYVIYGRSVFGDVDLKLADDRVLRPPMLRVRGLETGDELGWRVKAGLDVNGDRINDVFVASPRTDFGGIRRTTCAADFNRDGTISRSDLGLRSFTTCQSQSGQDLYSNDACKAFDYDNDGDIDADDQCVFCCLSDDCDPDDTCIFGKQTDCCEHIVDNGFVGIVFGGVFIDGDRDLTQLATSQLPGTIFFGSAAGHRAGYDISSAGDFNQDGFGDILIAVPGEVRADSAGRERLGVVYLVFGGTHLVNTTWDLKEVGSEDLPGIVFLSPYVRGRPNEAPPTTVAYIGDINNDGFGDIAVGIPKADFIDPSFPQGPDAPGSDPATGRRSDVGDAYVIYGNNFGTNRAIP